jgi:hypothetical protein
MPFDVGQVTREIQAEFGLFRALTRGAVNVEPPKNKATPEGLRALLDALTIETDRIREARRVVDIQWAHEDAFDSDLLKWRGRLGAYYDAVNAAPPGDRQAVLWSVTAPLLLGYFGGESSELPQQPIDAVTPFVLSNMLEESEAAQQRAWDLFIDDLQENAKKVIDTGKGIGVAVGFLAAAVVVAALVK